MRRNLARKRDVARVLRGFDVSKVIPKNLPAPLKSTILRKGGNLQRRRRIEGFSYETVR